MNVGTESTIDCKDCDRFGEMMGRDYVYCSIKMLRCKLCHAVIAVFRESALLPFSNSEKYSDWQGLLDASGGAYCLHCLDSESYGIPPIAQAWVSHF